MKPSRRRWIQKKPVAPRREEKGVWFDVALRCFRYNSQRLRGVYAYLNRKVFVKIEAKVKRQKSRGRAEVVLPAEADATNRGLRTVKGKPIKGARLGRARGGLVGKQLALIANGGQPKAPLHSYTQAVLKRFEQLGWTLVCGEYAVGLPAKRLGTGVDLVVRGANGLYHAVELKCGMHDYFESVSGKMKAPLENVPNSMYSQACLQLAVTHRLLEATTRSYATGLPYLVHVSKYGVTEYPLHQWAFLAADRFLASCHA
jgi:hypothetical protein